MIKRSRNRIGDWLRKIRWLVRLQRYVTAHRFWSRWEGQPEQIDLPAGQRIMVLAPHMDDEVIGCGGTLRKCVLSGKDVTVVYLTDGRQGDRYPPNIGPHELLQRQQKIIEIRKDEARQACEVLGINTMHFLDGEDQRLHSTPKMRGALSKILTDFQPDTLFVPFFLENHPDHRETARILVETTMEMSLNCECYAYEVWTAIYPNCMIDISSVAETKQFAILRYQSQLKHNNYLRTTLGLNAFRSMNTDGEGFAEAFWRSNLDTFRSFFLEVDGLN